MSTGDGDMLMANADPHNAAGELLVWPWTGVLATTTTTLLSLHAQQHFAAGVATTMLQDDEEEANHHHFLLLHFGKSWAGLRDAMSLGFHFAGAGRREWRRRQPGAGEGAGRVFGWPAGEEDLLGDGAVGKLLRESGATARSVEDVEKDEERVAATLRAVADDYKRREEFLMAKSEEMAKLVQKAEEESSWLHAELTEQKDVADNLLPEMNRGIDEENERLRAELDATTGEIESTVHRIQELKEYRTELHCSKVEKIVIEINSLEVADREARAKNHAQMLQEKHKEEMEAINAKVVRLEKQLEQKEALESAICMLNRRQQAGENLREEEREHLYKLMSILKECLEQEHETLMDAHVDLIKRDQLNKDEIQETRQELVKCLESMIGGCTAIGKKRMGQLDEKPFHYACKRKHRDDDPEGKAARLVSVWQEELKNTSWHPFTTILVDGEYKEVVDGDDPKLRQLRTEYGDSACSAVKNALRELNEYSPQGRQAVDELWNFREGRKATTAEAAKYIFEQMKMIS